MDSKRVNIRKLREIERRKKKRKRIFYSVIILILFIIFSICAYAYYMHKKIYAPNIQKSVLPVECEEIKQVPKEEKIDFREVEGVTNILLVGLDARTKEEPTRSDAMVILTIDDVHKTIKLTSLMRDLYTYIPGRGYEKLTHAYAYGKIDLLKETIKSNLNINIDKYAIINFEGFKSLIDELNGVEVDINNKEELKGINDTIDIDIDDNLYINHKKEVPKYVDKTGKQLLNGQQVLAFSRLRKVGNGTYDRVRRQREVLTAMMIKMKDAPLIKYPKILNSLIPYITTNLEITELLNLAYTMNKVGIEQDKILQLQIPTNELSIERDLGTAKGWVHLMDKKANIKVLNEFIFDNIKYDKSKYSSKLDIECDNLTTEKLRNKEDISKNKTKQTKYNKEGTYYKTNKNKEKIYNKGIKQEDINKKNKNIRDNKEDKEIKYEKDKDRNDKDNSLDHKNKKDTKDTDKNNGKVNEKDLNQRDKDKKLEENKGTNKDGAKDTINKTNEGSRKDR